MTITGAAEREKPGPADQPVTGDIVVLAVPYPAVADVIAKRADQGTIRAHRHRLPARFATGAIHLMPFAEGWTTRAAAAVMAD